jgi:sulfonate transport system permease protein
MLRLLHSPLIRRARPALSFVVLVMLWFWTAQRHVFPPQLFVSPQRVAESLWELLRSGELKMNLIVSLQRLAAGVAVGAAAGLPFGVAMAVSPRFEGYVRPSFNLIRQVPAVALIPVFILIFGIGETFKILIISKAAFYPIALAAYQAVRNLPLSYIEVARAYRLSRLMMLRLVIIPAATPELITGLRLALGRSWGTLVVAELLSSESGIGQMMEFARQMFRMDIVMAGLVVVGVTGFTLDRIIKLLERRFMHWRPA